MIPEPSLRRLPTYLHYLRSLAMRGREVVSTSTIAGFLKVDPTQVRKDLSYTGIVGTPRVGYDVPDLITAIEHYLGWDNTSDAFIVGVGHLGKALLGYEHLAEYGVNVVAAFDIDPDQVGKRFRDVEILSADRLPELARRMKVHLGILAVPAAAAQETADAMIRGGILAILNFSPTTLTCPDHVMVRDADFYSNVAVLTQFLKGHFSRKETTTW